MPIAALFVQRQFETSAKLFLQFAFLKYSSYLYRMKQKLSSPSFADLFLAQRKVKQTFFSQINTVIDWAPIRAIIEVAYTKGYKSTGRPSYDSLVLFKIELLRTWYGLSDGEVEEQVNDRLSFSRFAGLGMEDIVPDSTTVCRFRNILVEADLYDTLLAEFNRQLEAKGIIVKRGAIIDASITNTPRRPRGGKSYEVVEDRKEDENMEASEKAMLKEVVKPNVDKEARWVKKMGKLHFGYKRHTVTDENGMVLAEETTAANESDMKHLEHAQHIMESVAYNLYRTPGGYCVKLYQIIKNTPIKEYYLLKNNLQRHLLVKNIHSSKSIWVRIERW